MSLALVVVAAVVVLTAILGYVTNQLPGLKVDARKIWIAWTALVALLAGVTVGGAAIGHFGASPQNHTIRVGEYPSDITPSPDGRRMYVSSDKSIAVVDTTSYAIVETLAFPGAGGNLAVSADGLTGYTLDPGGLTEVNLQSGAAREGPRLNLTDKSCASVDVSAGRPIVAVVCEPRVGTPPGTLTLLDLTRGTRRLVTVGRHPVRVKLSPNGDTAYVVNAVDGTVSIIDTVRSAVVATVAVQGAFDAALLPNGSRLYVASPFEDAVSVIDTSSRSVVATLHGGRHPNKICTSRDGSHVYIANSESKDISDIVTSTNVVQTGGESVANPNSIAASANGRDIYVADVEEALVEVIESSSVDS